MSHAKAMEAADECEDALTRAKFWLDAAGKYPARSPEKRECLRNAEFWGEIAEGDLKRAEIYGRVSRNAGHI